MNGLSLLALVGIAIALAIAYRIGRMHGRAAAPGASRAPAADELRAIATYVPSPAPSAMPASAAADASARRDVGSAPATPAGAPAREPAARDAVTSVDSPGIAAEKSRLVIAHEAEVASLRRQLTLCAARAYRSSAFDEERRALLRELAAVRADLARYRQVLVDLENDAPPPILSERGMPDDLKLIVGIGPALERMLQQLGVGTYRQIARWTEHDIETMDARLPEFPGRIRRDAWVTQARELHLSKYGERP